MVIKFMAYADLHLAARNPVHRTASYTRDLLTKLEEVYSIAKKRDVEFVAFLGDFFNVHRMYSYDVINDAIDIIQASKLTTHAIIGQHDLSGYNQDSYQRSTLCFMERHCSSFKTLWEARDCGDVVIRPCHTFDDFEKCIVTKISRKIPKNKKSILLAHHLLSEMKMPFKTHVVSEIENCIHDAVLFGDQHTGMFSAVRNSTLFYGPGSLARISLSDADRKVRVGIVSVSEEGVTVSDEYLRSAKPAEEVFVQSVVECIKKDASAAERADKFVSVLGTLSFHATDIYDLVEKMATQMNVDRKIVDYLMTKRGEASEGDAA